MMKRIDVKVGFNCNNHCRFCVQGNKRELFKDRPTQEIKDILRQSRAQYEGVVFTGGEPTIRSDIVELVRYAGKLKFKVIQIQTNGRMFFYKKFCREIISAGANEFAPAVHGYNAKMHDYLTSSKGSFNQTVSGIRNLKAHRVRVLTNTVVNKVNYRHLPQIAKLLVGLGVDQFQFAFVHALGSAEKNIDSILPRMELIAPYVKRGLDVGIKAGITVMTEAMPYCIMGGYENYIAEKIIPETKIYDAEKTIDNFTEARVKEGKMRGPRCSLCRYYKVCEGPWKDYPNRFGWSEFNPVRQKAFHQ